MAESQFQCRVVTPEEEVFNGDVQSLVLPGDDGKFGVLVNHTPYIANLVIGEIKVVRDDSTRFMACSGGFAKISNNLVTVLAETAEHAEEIEVQRAREAYRRARERLREGDLSETDLQRTRDALRRAETRLNVAGIDIDEDDELESK